MKNSKTALNMLGVSSPVKQDGEIKDVSELMENVEGYNPRTGYVMQGASGNLGLVGGIGKGIGKGIAKLFSKLPWKKKPFWPQTKNTGDLYARARARVSETTARPKANVPSKPKEIKYKKSYHEHDILEPPSGYYSSDPNRPGWPMPLRKGDL